MQRNIKNSKLTGGRLPDYTRADVRFRSQVSDDIIGIRLNMQMRIKLICIINSTHQASDAAPLHQGFRCTHSPAKKGPMPHQSASGQA